MKNTVYIFLALMLCLGFVGGVSAFQISEPAVINPSGVLGTGETVTAEMELTFAAGSMEMGNEITLTTGLVSPVWTTTVITGGHEITTRTDTNRINSISGYLLGYPQEVILKVKLTGAVSSASAGSSICVISIEQEEAGINELKEYSTPVQYVYNTADLTKDIASVNSEISSLESKISQYSSYSADFTNARTAIASAKTELSKATNFGTNDFRNAITSLTSAEEYVDRAESLITKEILSLINLNTNTVDSTVSTLRAKGLTSEASLLSAANQGVKNSYNTALASYNSGGNPSVDSLFSESVNVVNIAKNYASATSTPTVTATKTATTATASVTPIVTATQTSGQTVVITVPNLFGSSEQIIFVESVIIAILCIVIIINVLIIKHLWKKNKGGKGKGRNSDEL